MFGSGKGKKADRGKQKGLTIFLLRTTFSSSISSH